MVELGTSKGAILTQNLVAVANRPTTTRLEEHPPA